MKGGDCFIKKKKRIEVFFIFFFFSSSGGRRKQAERAGFMCVDDEIERHKTWKNCREGEAERR